MLLLAWLPCLFGVVGCYYQTKHYGEKFTMRMYERTKTWEFIPSHSSKAVVLWRDGGTNDDSRRQLAHGYFTVYKVTQKDSGEYSLKTKNGIVLSTSYLDVEENSQSFTRKSGERFNVLFDLPPMSCNILLSLESENHNTEHRIVTQGNLDYDRYNQECKDVFVWNRCGIEIFGVETFCTGTFIFKDGDGNTALRAELMVESSVDVWKIGLGCGIASLLVSCCCCIKCCCCKKSKKDEAETPDGEAALNLQEYNHEPVALRSYQPDPVTLYPAVPSNAPAGPSEPLVHSSPPPMPPAYTAEVSFPADTSDGPTVTFPLDSGPRFELKGMKFDSPLDVNSSQSDVYTSDKLNFL